MDFKELIETLGEKTGIGKGLELDEENRCLIEFDGMGVLMQGIDEAHAATFLAQVGEPPPDRQERLYRALLEANHAFGGTFGATLSLDPASGLVCLCKTLDTAAMDGERFCGELEAFLNALEDWRTVLADYRAASPEAEDESPVPDHAIQV